MSGSLARAAPVRFLIGVVVAWTIGRGIVLVGWRPDATVALPAATMRDPDKGVAPSSTGLLQTTARKPFPSGLASPVSSPSADRSIGLDRSIEHRSSIGPSLEGEGSGPPWVAFAGLARPTASVPRPGGIVPIAFAAAKTPARPTSRLSGSAWTFVRGGGRAAALAPVGQIGGGQAGARILYTVDRPDRLALSARVSRTIGGFRQTEAAVGLDWKPLAALPVHLMAERRIAIDSGGRNAWTLGAAGGVDDVHVAPGWRLDGYGEAGVVGLRRRDLYADGAMRIARAIDLGRGTSLAAGGGAWGAAQPGAARLDLGPSLVLRAPVAGRFVAVSLDWRQRIVGDAKPGSGVALTLATSF